MRKRPITVVYRADECLVEGLKLVSACDSHVEVRVSADAADTEAHRQRMAMFVGDYLPYSETFIYDQLVYQRRFSSWVFARKWHADHLRFPYKQVITLNPLERLRYAVWGSARSYLSKLRELRPSIIHAHYGLNGVRALPFVEALDCPLAVTFHGHDIGGLFPKNRYTLRYFRYQKLASRMFDRASILLCCSQELADTLLNRFGAPESKLRVHHLGVDVRAFNLRPRIGSVSRLLMVGRLVEKKGFAYGIRAFAKIRTEFPDIRLTIIGDGGLRRSLMALSRELNLGDCVHFTGSLNAEGVRGAMEKADILLAPSVTARDGDRESGVIVIKEASASGLPTIGTRHGGIPEIIVHGETGFLVEERQVEPLAAALRQLIRDDWLRRRMSEAARAKALRDFDTRIQNRRLEEHLSSLI